jgi:rare lipoprotein A (peptidoglycan hydrolase)
LLVNIAITVALLPALFTGGDGESPSVTTVLISAPATTDPPTTTTTAAPATTTTTVPPTTVATAPPPTVAKKRQAAAATTTTTAKPRPKPTTTTTTAPPPRPAAAEEGDTESGRATWYELEGARPGYCAHKTLPFGTVVTVTNTDTGKSIQCTVGDRGPFVDGYVIDLYRTDFEKLAPTSKGWFPARITW